MGKRRHPLSGKLAPNLKQKRSSQKHAIRILHAIYQLARSDKLLEARAVDPTRAMLRDALRGRDTGLIFDWLVLTLSLQGVSDRVAIEYAERNGSATWKALSADAARDPSCPKLSSFWHYAGCGYSKSLQTCARPDHFRNCPLPKLNLRNGRLNQLSWSLLLWIRDIADEDIVRWIRRRLRPTIRSNGSLQDQRERLLGPLRGVYGVSDKVLSLAFADLLLAAPPRWRDWRRLGGALIVIDTLVHNNLVRTGILSRSGTDHAYGPACYRPKGCADVIDRVAEQLRVSPRALTHAVWRYCSQDGLAICNGLRINDRRRCDNKYCRLHRICDRRKLHVK